MATSPTKGLPLLRAALLGAAAFAFFQSAPVQARIGVTSATDGDPLGKPPLEAERVLRIGIDVQANEVVTTGANDRAHLVFLDGTSVTVGPNARLTIDTFVYDPATRTGELAITASKGVFRLVGGKISKNNPVTINTPSSTIGIRGGITMFTVTDGQTTSTFIFGSSMTVTSQGVTQTATRAGFQVTSVLGRAPGMPKAVPPGGLSASISSLEGSGSGSGSSGGGSADSGAAGFGAGNSGAGPKVGGMPPSSPPPSITRPTDATPPPTETATVPKPPTSVSRTNHVDNSNNGGLDTSLKGFVGGIVEQTDAIQGPSTRILSSGGSPNNVKIETETATSRASATIIVQNFSEGASATFQLGGLGSNSGPSGFFVNDQTYLVTDTANDPTRRSKVTVTPQQGPPVDVDITPTTLLVSSAFAPTIAQVLSQSGVTPCVCNFLTWGEWLGTASYTTPAYRQGAFDFLNNVTYVAGTLSTVASLDALTNAANLPGANQQNFIATYNGHMVGGVQSGGNSYMAAGPIKNVWSFGPRSGVVTGSFDGLAFNGTANLVGNGPRFVSNLAVPGLSAGVASINGAFFASPTDPVKGQAGSFSLAGQRTPTGGGPAVNYQAGGTFAAQK